MKLLTISDVARIKGVSREVVRAWFRAGLGADIPGLKRRRTTLEAVEKFLEIEGAGQQSGADGHANVERRISPAVALSVRPNSGPINEGEPRQTLAKRTNKTRAAGPAKLKKGEWRQQFRG